MIYNGCKLFIEKHVNQFKCVITTYLVNKSETISLGSKESDSVIMRITYSHSLL